MKPGKVNANRRRDGSQNDSKALKFLKSMWPIGAMFLALAVAKALGNTFGGYILLGVVCFFFLAFATVIAVPAYRFARYLIRLVLGP